MKIKLHLLFFSSMVLCCFFEIKSSNIKTVTLPEVSFTSPLVPTIFDLYVDSTLKTLEDPQNNYYIYISFKRYNKTNEPYPYVFISVAQKEFFYPIKIKGYTTYRDIFVFVSGNMSDCFTKEESNLKEFKYSKYRGLYEGCMEWWFQIVGDTIKLVNHIDWRKPWLGFNGLGWYDNRARVLDALTGRFTTPDPLAGRYPDQSPYAHCANNPVRFIDPTGRVLEYPSSPSSMSFNYKMRDVRAYIGTEIKDIEEKLRNSPHHFVVFDANREGGGNRIRTILKLFRK